MVYLIFIGFTEDCVVIFALLSVNVNFVSGKVLHYEKRTSKISNFLLFMIRKATADMSIKLSDFSVGRSFWLTPVGFTVLLS